MKILLIRAPQIGFYHEMYRHMPIGMAYIASSCRINGHTVDLFDSLAYPQDNHFIQEDSMTPIQKYKIDHHPAWHHFIYWGASEKRIIEYLLQSKPDVVGISSMFSPMYDTAYNLVNIVKRYLPNAKIVIGGMHATVAYEHILRNTEVDYVMTGEGEISFPTLLDCIENKKSITSVQGLAYIKQGEVIYQPVNTWNCDLDSLPYPSVDLLNMKQYDNTATLITSRGCPFSCKFCTIHPMVGNRYRSRSPQNVIDEIEWYVKKHNINKFNIEDDNFTYDIQRVKEILKMIIDKPYSISLRFSNGVTAVEMTKDVIDLFVRAGMEHAFVGLESTSNQTLSTVNKTFTSFNKVKRIINEFHSFGKNMSASLILGLPNQTLDDIINDIVTLVNNGISFNVTPFYPMIGSELYDECLNVGLIDPNIDYTWFCEYNFPFETENFSRRDIYELWIACRVINHFHGIWMDNSQRNMRKLSLILNIKGKIGNLRKVNDDYILEMLPGASFTERMQIKVNPNALLDSIDEDFIATMLYLYTNEYYHVKQIDNAFSNMKYAKFLIKKNGVLCSCYIKETTNQTL